jgi:predicted TPR repeat methyltransferase
MTTYDTFAQFYDQTMGDRTETARYLKRLIREHHRDAGTALELACGTGEIMRILSDEYDVSGLELSSGMLRLAKKKLPYANFYHQSMAGFDLPYLYDVVYCVFDSINHLLKFSEWKKLFKSASAHLDEGGIFIFDMNTVSKLEEVVTREPAVYDCDGNVAIMDINTEKRGIACWNVKVFEKQKGDLYRLHEEDIREISFPLETVAAALNPLFRSVTMIERKRSLGDEGERVYFVCKK